VSPQLATDLAEVEGVAVATGYKQSEAQIALPDGKDIGANVGAIDPEEYAQVFSIRMDTGSLVDLADGGVIVDREIADTHDLRIGDEVSALFPGGQESAFRVAAIGDDATLLGDWTITAADQTRLTVEPIDVLVAIKVTDGTDPDTLRSELRAEVDRYPTVALQDREQFIGSLTATINQFLIIIIALLGLSIVIALIGIANTLSLSIHERTRELGLLRAVGMTRGQLRSTIRWEAIVVALIGTVLGLAMSVGLSWLVIKGLQGYGLGTYVVPWGQMAFVVLLGAGLGVLAALRPAQRAGKLNMLDAIGAE
jgi:putative ABC transport system permease protein